MPNPKGSRQRVHDMVVALYVSERSGAPLLWLDRAALMSSDDEFEQFFLAHYEAVLSVLVLTTGDRERATDATQEAPSSNAVAQQGRHVLRLL